MIRYRKRRMRRFHIELSYWLGSAVLSFATTILMVWVWKLIIGYGVNEFVTAAYIG